jgi:hypothetical protein
MFGSARCFLVPVVGTLSLLACSLETPGRSGRGEPWPSEFDAGVVLDAAGAGDPGIDAAGEAGQLDAEPAPPGHDAAPDATLPQGDAAPGELDAAPDALSPSDAEADATLVDAATEAGTERCSLDGVFAVEVLFDAEWNGTTLAGIVPLLKPGAGQIQIIARLDLRGGGLQSRGLVSACGAVMPDFTAGNILVGNENYAGYFPDEGWDAPSMPRWDLGWQVGCDQPGCSLDTELLVATIGARNAGDIWPGRKGPISNIVPLDHDGDGHPAVTIGSRGPDERNAAGVPYKLIPVTWTLTERSPRAFVPVRVMGEFHGKLDSCDELSGVVTAGSVEARCVGCVKVTDGQSQESACSPQEATFMDENLPDWMVTSGTWRARRVPATAECGALRALWER